MSDKDFAVKLDAYKKGIEKAKTDRAKAEATKEQLEIQQKKIEHEIRSLGVEPDKLDEAIAELENQIAADMAKLDELIPKEYRG
jgi:chromosome segregation ATPase